MYTLQTHKFILYKGIEVGGPVHGLVNVMEPIPELRADSKGRDQTVQV